MTVVKLCLSIRSKVCVCRGSRQSVPRPGPGLAHECGDQTDAGEGPGHNAQHQGHPDDDLRSATGHGHSLIWPELERGRK